MLLPGGPQAPDFLNLRSCADNSHTNVFVHRGHFSRLQLREPNISSGSCFAVPKETQLWQSTVSAMSFHEALESVVLRHSLFHGLREMAPWWWKSSLATETKRPSSDRSRLPT